MSPNWYTTVNYLFHSWLQVKELETIVRRRAHPNFSNVNEIIRSSESRMYEKESETIKNLKKELLDKQHIIIDLKNQMVESKVTDLFFIFNIFASVKIWIELQNSIELETDSILKR